MLEESQTKLFIQSFEEILGKYAINSTDNWFSLQKSTIKDHISKNKRIFVFYKDYKTTLKNHENIGLFEAEIFFFTKWHDVNDV